MVLNTWQMQREVSGAPVPNHKSDVFAEVHNEIVELRNEIARLKVVMADCKSTIVKWIVGLIAAVLLGYGAMTAAIIVTLIRVTAWICTNPTPLHAYPLPSLLVAQPFLTVLPYQLPRTSSATSPPA